ncbi:GumN family protein [Geotalea daltonii FRC-32]|uniref:GumN family protein n=1 Tax=Geotalea daltonii (strain DSM 22248 / JCM 15807 / FRC-32) TaxID=316067 RepID=B9M8V1_GEODF|nr:TraB/GumN family protein [Geotalea daltonii]ACM20447.1 GumN family protein [Geotalea daltonii FRC-32]
MKGVIWSIMLVLLFCTGASAESSVWKAQKDNSTIYLGGTCHVLRESDYPLPPEFEKAYKASETVVFETDIAKLQDPSMQQQLLAKAMYTDGSTADKHLSPKVYGQLSSFCETNGIPIKAFSQFKPAMIMLTLTVIELKKLGATEQGVDQFFHSLASRDKKPVEGLETVEEQIDYIATMADGNEDDFVLHSLKDMKTMDEQFSNLAAAWRKGDGRKLDELMVNDLKSRQPQLYKRLITDRNRNWFPLIDAYLKTPRTEFILVGVGHLVGPDGIVEALKKKGYKVEKF